MGKGPNQINDLCFKCKIYNNLENKWKIFSKREFDYLVYIYIGFVFEFSGVLVICDSLGNGNVLLEVWDRSSRCLYVVENTL